MPEATKSHPLAYPTAVRSRVRRMRRRGRSFSEIRAHVEQTTGRRPAFDTLREWAGPEAGERFKDVSHLDTEVAEIRAMLALGYVLRRVAGKHRLVPSEPDSAETGGYRSCYAPSREALRRLGIT